MNSDDREHQVSPLADAMRRARRRERREAIALIVISALFVLLGIALWLGAGQLMGLVVALFFGGCGMTGILQLRGGGQAGSTSTQVWMAVSAMVAGLGCLLYVVGALAGDPMGSGWRQANIFSVVLFSLGTVFFLGGGILLLVRRLRARATPRPRARPLRDRRAGPPRSAGRR